MTNNEKIGIVADEVKRNMKFLSEMVGCHAIGVDYMGNIEFHCTKLEKIDGKLLVKDRNSTDYPHEYYKLIDGVKFFKVGE